MSWTIDALREQVAEWDRTLAEMHASPSRQEDRDQFLRTSQAFCMAAQRVNSEVADKLRTLLAFIDTPDPRLAKVEALVAKFRERSEAAVKGARVHEYDSGREFELDRCADELEAALGTSKEGR